MPSKKKNKSAAASSAGKSPSPASVVPASAPPSQSSDRADVQALAGRPADSLADIAAALNGQPPKAAGPLDEPPPPLSARHVFLPLGKAISVGKTKSGKPLPASLFEAQVSTPSGETHLAHIRGAEDGKLHCTYLPSEPGEHTMQLRYQGTPIGPVQTLRASMRPARTEWATLNSAERQQVLAWLARRLHSAGLDALYAVASTVLTVPVPVVDGGLFAGAYREYYDALHGLMVAPDPFAHVVPDGAHEGAEPAAAPAPASADGAEAAAPTADGAVSSSAAGAQADVASATRPAGKAADASDDAADAPGAAVAAADATSTGSGGGAADPPPAAAESPAAQAMSAAADAAAASSSAAAPLAVGAASTPPGCAVCAQAAVSAPAATGTGAASATAASAAGASAAPTAAPESPPRWPAPSLAAAAIAAAAAATTPSPEHSLRVLGAVPAGRAAARWAALAESTRRLLAGVACAVLTARQQWQRGDGEVAAVPLRAEEARTQLQRNYSRSGGTLRRLASPIELGGADGRDAAAVAAAREELDGLAAALAEACETVLRGHEPPPLRLRLVAYVEEWVHAGLHDQLSAAAAAAAAVAAAAPPAAEAAAAEAAAAQAAADRGIARDEAARDAARTAASADAGGGAADGCNGGGEAAMPGNGTGAAGPAASAGAASTAAASAPGAGSTSAGGASEGEARHVAAVQLEGCAPVGLRPFLEAAAAKHVQSLADAAAAACRPPPLLQRLGALELDSVVWYESRAQAALHVLRLDAAAAAGRPPPRDSPGFLNEMEDFCNAAVPDGLPGLLARCARTHARTHTHTPSARSPSDPQSSRCPFSPPPPSPRPPSRARLPRCAKLWPPRNL